MTLTTTKNMTNKRLKPVVLATSITLLSLASLSLTGCSNMHLGFDEKTEESASVTVDDTITLEQITKDVSYLASNNLQGRNNFTPNIRQAADFIAKRFNEVGLTPAPSDLNFKQQYLVQRITPNMLTVEINGQAFDSESLSMATTATDFDWNSNVVKNNLPVNIVMVGEDDNMRKSLSELNKQGGQHLVLLHPKHEESFKRYQSYFAQGLTKLVDESATEQGGVIVIALTDISKVIQFNVKGNAKVSTSALSNVVGILPGKSKANEIVLYSAHYDHLGVKPSIDGAPNSNAQQSSDIFNGADDDASGVSAIINLANHFAKLGNNERTLMFAAFSAEEIGGFGSKHFSTNLEPTTITAMINIEMVGKPAVFGDGTVWMTGMDRSNLGEQLNQALAPQNLKVYADPYPKQNLFYRSDNATLARLGVPAHSFSSTQLDKDQHYHQVTDDINSLNLPSMLQVVKMLAIATTPLVDGSITPSRIDPNKVKRSGLIY
ncbi:M28 family peptidase [Colwellia psychrerythraea]|uniref:Putative peptidase, M28 family n=1 Tax=Colwellia psychrerythraea (strain 34H / ATCC BAA-681) TaxID=167879 RepID=Q482V4_COLP3|nr:M28 family peptidase [Colwellia psychrerythraea]AAZ24898.1 putative peptidase, M28 family [Colwellia psychrerythraea 34H]